MKTFLITAALVLLIAPASADETANAQKLSMINSILSQSAITSMAAQNNQTATNNMAFHNQASNLNAVMPAAGGNNEAMRSRNEQKQLYTADPQDLPLGIGNIPR